VTTSLIISVALEHTHSYTPHITYTHMHTHTHTHTHTHAHTRTHTHTHAHTHTHTQIIMPRTSKKKQAEDHLRERFEHKKMLALGAALASPFVQLASLVLGFEPLRLPDPCGCRPLSLSELFLSILLEGKNSVRSFFRNMYRLEKDQKTRCATKALSLCVTVWECVLHYVCVLRTSSSTCMFKALSPCLSATAHTQHTQIRFCFYQ